MTSSARDFIFKALAKQAKGVQPDVSAIEAEAQALLDMPENIRPAAEHSNIIDAFVERINGPKVVASVEKIHSLNELPARIEAFLQVQNRELNICVQPTVELTNVDWASAKIDTDGELDDGVSVSLARWGIAETGSLVVHSGADTPILLNMLPAVNIIVVHASKLLWHLEDYAAAAKETGEGTPRNACIITGASGTTDIEGSLVIGAHGPGVLHVVIVAD